MKVHVVIIRGSVDYEGSSDEIYNVYEDEDDARKVVRNFQEKGPHRDGIVELEYFYNTYEVTPKK